jgi:uncharacterized membrane protein YbhN (UPF0104 family)
MSRWSRRQLWCAKLVATAVLLSAVLAWADVTAVRRVLAGLDMRWLTVAAVLFVPQTLLSAVRWRYLCRGQVTFGPGEALRQTLAASASNLVVPGKLGDVIKSAMLARLAELPLGRRVGLVVTERAFDVVALLALWTMGGAIMRLGGGGAALWAIVLVVVVAVAATVLMRTRLRSIVTPGRLAGVGGMSLLLWTLHLGQIQALILAAGVDASWLTAMARVPAAIFAGLVPVSLWGVGTRDAALIALYADVATASTMAAVGILTASRYLVPGLAGVPFLLGYLSGKSGWLSGDSESARERRSGEMGAVSISPDSSASLARAAASGSR